VPRRASEQDPDRDPVTGMPRAGSQPGVDSDADVVGVPWPRPALDDRADTALPASDAAGDLSKDGSVEPVWRYDQMWNRGNPRHYNGYVESVGGVEGQRLSEALAAAIRDLLTWVNQHPDASSAARDGESGKDSDRDGRSDDTSL